LKIKQIISIIIVLFGTEFCIAQELVLDTASSRILEADFDLLDGITKSSNSDKVSVASYIDIGKNEAPGIITTISSQEIEELGSRDLIDILNTVPGFTLGADVQNGLAYGIRGNWAEEGKLLFMIDGMPMNEMGYGTYVIGHRFPINIIERVEIIRGAGSALYGGLAGLGVVNIITKKGQKINGHKIYLNGGISNNSISRGGFNYMYGGALKSGGEITVSGLVNFGNRSNLEMVLPNSQNVSLKDSSYVINQNLNINLIKNNFNFKLNYEDYNFQSTYEPISSTTRTFIGELNKLYTIKKLTFTPFFRYKWQYPWLTDNGDPATYDQQNTISARWASGINSNYLFNNNLNLSFGINYYSDYYRYFKKSIQQALVGERFTNFRGISFYSELFYDLKFTKIFMGVRFDKYAFFKPFYAPRLTITKSYRNFFYKILGNISYKIPTHQNILISNNRDISPEVIKETQVQLGYSNNTYEVSATAFYNNLNGLIVYSYDSLIESYKNSGFINTLGYEIEGKVRLNKMKLTGNYSFYQPTKSNAQDVLIDNNNVSKGTFSMPKHRLFLGITYSINSNVSINLFDLIQSSKTISTYVDLANTAGTNQTGIYNTINATCQIKSFYKNSIKLNFGIYNILNQKQFYGYAYKSAYQPMVGMGRELFIHIRMNL
jgi:outer membrane receptor for ferrienterochelin and colicin